jgi:hypothetical protein
MENINNEPQSQMVLLNSLLKGQVESLLTHTDTLMRRNNLLENYVSLLTEFINNQLGIKPPDIPIAFPSRQPEILIIYSQKDDGRWLERLKTHLDSLNPKAQIRYWDDEKPKLIQNWRGTLAIDLKSADAIILLSSHSLMSSELMKPTDDTTTDTLPDFLNEAREKGIQTLTVLLDPVVLEDEGLNETYLVKLTAKPPKPLNKFRTKNEREAEGERIFAEIARLSQQLITTGKLPEQPPAKAAKISNLAQSTRTSIFISYSHVDKQWRERIEMFLKHLSLEKEVEWWSDEKIDAGDLWRDEISHALAKTRVAIMLVSQEFLISKFINQVELPGLLNAVKAEGVALKYFLISPCTVKLTILSEYQRVNDKYLIDMSESEWRQSFNALVDELRTIFGVL